MNMVERPSVRNALDIIIARERPVTGMPVQLKDGSSLGNILPYEIAPAADGILRLFFLDAAGIVKTVVVNDIRGLDVVPGEGKYEGEWLVSFAYYKPDFEIREQHMESAPRRVLVTEIEYGATKNHFKFGEGDDFYFRVEDTQYADRPREERIRRFPFWRCGIYGDSEAIEGEFMRESEPVVD